MAEETLLENQATKSPKTRLVFRHFPGYALFIRENYLVPYVQELLRISRLVNLPLLKFFEGIPEDELISMSLESSRQFLTYAEENKLNQQIEKSLATWKSDQLGIMKREEVTAGDINLVSYIRKKALLKFLPSYTADVYESIEIIKEIDSFTVESDAALTNLYIQLLKKRINDQAFFTEIISNTTPGLYYIYDIDSSQLTYANKNYLNFFGYSLEELKKMGSDIVAKVIHAEEIPATMEAVDKCILAADGEVISWENRLKNKEGKYIWMRSYASVFKRNEQGKPVELVGFILDIDKEKETGDKLLLREKQLLDAQAQAQLGSFDLDIATGAMEVTPQFKEIYELSEFDLYTLIDHVHPADRDRINANRDKAIAENSLYDNEYRYLINGREKVIWSRGVIINKEGRKVMRGTVMDITNRNKMVRELLESRDLYQQAQKIAHIGNWTWNLQTNETIWSDELFRIYGMGPAADHLLPEISRTYRHPDDTKRVDEQVQLLKDLHIPLDYNFRIILPGGQIKHLNVKADVARDDTGKVVTLFGTIQDITEKQSLIERLQESDMLFKQAQELSHIGNWIWDLNSGKIEWSDELYKIYGLTPGAELTFEDIISFNRPEDNVVIKQKLKKSKETFEPSDTYYHITLADGTQKVLHAKTETLSDAGIAYKMAGTIQDVTEKQLLIERLLTSEGLYKQAQAISHIGNWSLDLETKKLEWSDELYRIYELEPHTADTITTLAKYNHPEDKSLIREAIKYAVATSRPLDFNYRILLKGNKIKTLNARGEIKTGENGKSLKIYGTVQDITMQKNAERQLKEYQEFIEKITDVTPSIIAAYNISNGQYSFINDAVEKLLGYSPIEVMEKGVAFMASIVHPDDIAALTEKNTKALEEANLMLHNNNEPIVEFKYRMQNSNGEYRWFHTYGTIFERDEQGLVESVLNISVDITEQERAEQALYQKNLQLQQSNTSLEEYAYVASHDLKETLRKITTFSDRILATQYAALNEDGKIYFNKIIIAANRMQKMINDLLSVSTILGNNAYETCDLNVVLAEAIQPLDHKIEEGKAVIEASTLPTIYAVPSQFRQLFQNLIGNSLKFARPGFPSHIKITHKTVNYKAVQEYDLAKAKKYLQIEIEDNGIGFDNQYGAKIFAIFQRLHGKTEYDGTGIGLAICKKVVENHGGIIFAKGNPQQGAIFTIILPV